MMAAQIKSESVVKAAVSVSGMCRMLKMSRSQFYWHVKKGTFHEPHYLPTNKRPYFTAEMVEANLRARETSIGVSGEYIIFYERQQHGDGVPTSKKVKPKPVDPNDNLIDSLNALGLVSITSEQVETAKRACFPTGTNGQDEGAVLRAIFRHLRRAETD